MNTRQRLLRALRHQIRENSDEEQVFLDIETLLSGAVVKDEARKKICLYRGICILSSYSLFGGFSPYPTSNSVEDEWKRRDDAVDAVTPYWDVQVGDPLRARPKQIGSKSISSTDPNTDLTGSSNIRDKDTETTFYPRDEL